MRALRLFGSVLRGEAPSSSDIDFLVDIEGPPTFRRFMGLKFALEELLGAQVALARALKLNRCYGWSARGAPVITGRPAQPGGTTSSTALDGIHPVSPLASFTRRYSPS